MENKRENEMELEISRLNYAQESKLKECIKQINSQSISLLELNEHLLDIGEKKFKKATSVNEFVDNVLSVAKTDKVFFDTFWKILDDKFGKNHIAFNEANSVVRGLKALQELEDFCFQSFREAKVLPKTLEDFYAKLIFLHMKKYPGTDKGKTAMFRDIADDNNLLLVDLIKSSWQEQEKVWKLTESFLLLYHKKTKEEIQSRRDNLKKELNPGSKDEDIRCSVLFSVKRHVTQKPTSYYVTVYQWNGTSYSCVEQSKEALQKKEIQKFIISNLNKLQVSLNPEKTAIEFFLPDELLHLNVDEWAIERIPGHNQPIGILYYVLVRSQERLDNQCKIQKSVNARWKHLCSSFDKEEEWKIKWLELSGEIKVANLVGNEYNCTGFTTVVDNVSVKKMKGFSASGIPIALWVRKDINAWICDKSSPSLNFPSILEEHLKINNISCINDLMKAVLNLRQEMVKKGSYISLFWDDPSRYIPQSKAQFPKSE